LVPSRRNPSQSRLTANINRVERTRHNHTIDAKQEEPLDRADLQLTSAMFNALTTHSHRTHSTSASDLTSAPQALAHSGTEHVTPRGGSTNTVRGTTLQSPAVWSPCITHHVQAVSHSPIPSASPIHHTPPNSQSIRHLSPIFNHRHSTPATVHISLGTEDHRIRAVHKIRHA